MVLKHPGYTEIRSNNGDIVKGDEQYFSIWKPNHHGYIVMGNVFKFERGSTPFKELVSLY